MENGRAMKPHKSSYPDSKLPFSKTWNGRGTRANRRRQVGGGQPGSKGFSLNSSLKQFPVVFHDKSQVSSILPG